MVSAGQWWLKQEARLLVSEQFTEIEDAANWIYFYKTMKDSSIPEDQILDIKPIAKAYDIFFADMVKVSQKDGKFILSGDNDQRIQTALICHVPLIPVILI